MATGNREFPRSFIGISRRIGQPISEQRRKNDLAPGNYRDCEGKTADGSRILAATPPPLLPSAICRLPSAVLLCRFYRFEGDKSPETNLFGKK